MTRPVVSVRKFAGGPGLNLWLWCPGCDGPHTVTVADETGKAPSVGPVWTWNGDVDAPTIQASILVTSHAAGVEVLRCHSFVEEGRWRYLADSTHALAGQTVDVPPMPEGWP